MDLSLVVAMSRDGVIGYQGALPWKLPRDLKHFRQLTWGKPIIMGRKTYQSLGRPLPGRTNIVLSRHLEDLGPGCLVARDRGEALELAAATGGSEAMIIGGGQVYETFLPLGPTIHLTLVEGRFPGDVYFPAPLLHSPNWQIVHQERWAADERNPHDAVYLILRPVSGQTG